LEYFEVFGTNPALLSANERQNLQSIKRIVIADKVRIRLFVSAFRSASYADNGERDSGIAHCVHVRCYRGQQGVASFSLCRPSSLVFDDGRRLECRPLPEVASFVPELNGFVVRTFCASRLQSFGELLAAGKGGTGGYLDPAKWCDQIFMPREPDRLPTVIKKMADQFKCPGARGGECDYAMNPSCRRDSAPDVVLLFESKIGWNQHGGPELFMFDNHDPKGGCVLLNDGTVRFVHTEQELKQFRWK